MSRTPLLSLLVALLLTGLVWAREVTLEGAVQGIDLGARTLTLSTSQGWQRVWIQSSTDVESQGARVDWTQLRQGDRVTVEGIPLDDGRIVASRIRVSGGGSGFVNQPVLTPVSGGRTTSLRPTVSARFGENLSRARLWVDGADFSGQAQISGDTVSWTPNYNLDYGQHTVRVQASSVYGRACAANWSFQIAGAESYVQVSGYAPAPGSVVTVLQPPLSAEFTGPVDNRSIRFYVDGQDFTPQVQISGRRVTWYPRYNLDWGQHTARLEARTLGNQPVTGTWNFVIQR